MTSTQRTLIGAAGMLLLLFLVWLYGRSQYNAGIDECNRQHNELSLQAFKDESEKLTGLSTTLNERISELEKSKPKIIERYINVATKIPLPDVCILDADRLRYINDSIRAANSASKSSTAVQND